MNTALLREDLEQIRVLEAELEGLRSTYADNPRLFSVYSQAKSYRLELLRTRLRNHVAAEDVTADFWVRLTGPAIGTGAGSMEAIASFIDRFRVAVKHAVSVLEGIAYTGGRFVADVEAATNFQLVATAPGSFQLGVNAPEPVEAPSLPPLALLDTNAVRDAIAESVRRRTLGLRGISLILQALEAAEDDGALQSLRDAVDDHGTLRVLYHARALFPRGIDGVEFRGRGLGRARRYGAATRERLRELGERLVQRERYIQGFGVLQALDIARRTVRLDYSQVSEVPTMNTVNADYPVELEDEVRASVGRVAAFAGTLKFDQKGVAQRVMLDALVKIETEERDEVDTFLGLS